MSFLDDLEGDGTVKNDPTFKHGQEVANICLPGHAPIVVGQDGCTKIVVVMEAGQMAGVHWFEVTWEPDEPVVKYNGALVESVELK